jgi:hypothetical protein
MVGQFIDFLFYFLDKGLQAKLRAQGERLTEQVRQFMAQVGQFLDHVVDGFVPRQHPERFSEQDFTDKLALAPAGGGQHAFMQILAFRGSEIDGQAGIDILQSFLHAL